MEYTSQIEMLQRRWQGNLHGTMFAPLAEAYRKAGMFQDALGALEIGLANHPNYVPGHIVLGRCYLDLRDDAKAAATFGRVIELDTENVIALKSLADISERAGRSAEAIAHLGRLLEFDPHNEDAKDQLERIQAAVTVTPEPETERQDLAPEWEAGTVEHGEVLDPALGPVEVHLYQPIELTSAASEEFRLHNDSEILEPAAKIDPSDQVAAELLAAFAARDQEAVADEVLPDPALAGAESELKVVLEEPVETTMPEPEAILQEPISVPTASELVSAAPPLPPEPFSVEAEPSVSPEVVVESPVPNESAAPILESVTVPDELATPDTAPFVASAPTVPDEPAVPAAEEALETLSEESPVTAPPVVAEEPLVSAAGDSVEAPEPPAVESLASDPVPAVPFTLVEELPPIESLSEPASMEETESRAAEPEAALVTAESTPDEPPPEVEVAVRSEESVVEPADGDSWAAPPAAIQALAFESAPIPMDEPAFDPDVPTMDAILAEPEEPAAPVGADSSSDRAVADADVLEEPVPTMDAILAGRSEQWPLESAPEAPAAPEEPELLVTETMAEIFLRQGHQELAIAVYRQLTLREPENPRLREALIRLGGAPPEPPPVEEPSYTAARTGGTSVATFFAQLLGGAVPVAPAPAAGTGGEAEPGKLSLSSVFGDEMAPLPRPPRPPAESGPSFDEFFAEGKGDDRAAHPESAGSRVGGSLPVDDLEQFNAWLKGLKR